MALHRPTRGRFELRHLLTAAVFAGTTVAFFSPALLTGQTAGATDILQFASPYRESHANAHRPDNPLQHDQMVQLPLVAEFWDAVRRGDLQLWEPDQAAGIPLFTGVHNRVLAPWFVAFLVVPAPFAPTVAVVVGFLVGQLGTYGLARRLGLGWGGSLFAAVAYVFSGPSTALVLRIHEVLLLPCLLYALHGALTARRRGWFLVLVAVTMASSWLSGFPAAGLFNLYTATAFLLVVAWASTEPAATRLRRLRHWLAASLPPVAALVAGTLLAGVQLFPSYEFLQVTRGVTRSLPLSHAAGLVKLATALSGRFFGTFQFGSWWSPYRVYANPVEASSTVGLVSLGLIVAIVAGIRGERRDEPELWLRRLLLPTGLVVLAAVYLGGPALGLVHLLPFMATNSFGRARYILALALALAAGYGLDLLVARRRGAAGRAGPWVRLQLAVVLTAITAGAIFGFVVAHREHRLALAAASLVVPTVVAIAAGLAVWLLGRRATWLALVISVLAALELQWGAWRFVPASPPELFYPDSPAFDAVVPRVGPGAAYRFVGIQSSVLPSHAAAYLDLKDVRAEYPIFLPYEELLRTVDPGLPRLFGQAVFFPRFSDRFDLESPILDRMSARILITGLKEEPLQTAPPVPVSVPAGRLPRSFDVPVPDGGIRALRLQIRPANRDCREGWIELRVGDHVQRRLLRDFGGWSWVTVPDLQPSSRPLDAELSATSCPAEVAAASGEVLPPAPDTSLEIVSTNGWVVYQRDRALPRVSLAEQTVEIEDREGRLAFLARRPAREGVVTSGGFGSRRMAGGAARLMEDSPDRVVVGVEARGAGLLVLRDVAAPGWRASVDGQPAEIIDVDHAFRGVAVPQGRSKVVFSYRPTSLRVGVVASILGVALTAALAWWGQRGSGVRSAEDAR